jgi:hypothetical protein
VHHRGIAVILVLLSVGLTAGIAQASPPQSIASPTAGWSIQPSPNPDGALGSSLSSVSCPGDGTCTAVGIYNASNVDLTLAEHWDGSAWSVESTPNPRRATYNDLSGISCAGSTCLAVGVWISGNKVRPLALLRSGSSWSLKLPPKPLVASWAALESVSCVETTDCTAVGGFIKKGVDAQEQPLAEHWDGTSWSIEPVPNPHAENGSSLDAVSCVSGGVCEAAGSYVYADVVEAVLAFRWNGSKWAQQPEPDPGGGGVSEQHAISCSDASSCTATGNWQDDSGFIRTLAERWDGESWQIQQSTEPPTSQFAETPGVSCPAADACTSVGYWSPSINALPQYTLAERWNGTSWAVQSTPQPQGSTDAALSGVACAAPGVCVAVGGAQVNGVFVTLVEVRSH